MNRNVYQRIRPISAILVCFFLLCSCTPSPIQIKNLGNISYSAKTLDGLFFEEQDDLYLISGTEVSTGGNSQVFVYNVMEDQIIMSQTLQNCVSMTAFLEVGNCVYVASCSESSRNNGCDLYVWEKGSSEVVHCAHFTEQNIYDLYWDGGGEVYVATSYPTGVYAYDLESGYVRTVCQEPAEGPYIRSMSGGGGKLYLGIGTQADLLEMDPETGEFHSVLPERYRSQSFVYAQTSLRDKIYFRTSAPNYDILIYDANTGTLTDSGLTFQQGGTLEQAELSLLENPDITALDLWGDQLLIDQTGNIVGHLSTKGVASWLDLKTGYTHYLDGSTFYYCYSPQGELLAQRDLSSLLEKTYVIPGEFLAYDRTIYIPSRRFLVCDTDSLESRAYLVIDEPQASTVTADGIYTTNYTEATVYFYP